VAEKPKPDPLAPRKATITSTMYVRIPPPLLDALHLAPGHQVTLRVVGTQLILEAVVPNE